MVNTRPARCSARLVNLPSAGPESVIVVGTYRTDPMAQLGTQPSMPDLPLPDAPVAVHEVHRIPVTMLPPSALKSISAGSRPVNPPMVRTGSPAAGDAVDETGAAEDGADETGADEAGATDWASLMDWARLRD
jgi:hypothetical protein